jgi:hypothetical protein
MLERYYFGSHHNLKATRWLAKIRNYKLQMPDEETEQYARAEDYKDCVNDRRLLLPTMQKGHYR